MNTELEKVSIAMQVLRKDVEVDEGVKKEAEKVLFAYLSGNKPV